MSKAHTILIVDDQPGEQDLLKILLERSGILTISVHCVDDAILKLSEVSLVVTDYNLGPSDGITLLQRILGTCPELPVILISGEFRDGIKERALEVGASGVFLKTPKCEEIIAAVKKLLLVPTP